jgi:hypothetical protein
MQIGPNKHGGEEVTKLLGDTRGLTCPEEVNQDNWEGDYTFGDSFKVKVTPEAVIVDRNGARTWDMNLRFNCVSCPAEKEEPLVAEAAGTCSQRVDLVVVTNFHLKNVGKASGKAQVAALKAQVKELVANLDLGDDSTRVAFVGHYKNREPVYTPLTSDRSVLDAAVDAYVPNTGKKLRRAGISYALGTTAREQIFAQSQRDAVKETLVITSAVSSPGYGWNTFNKERQKLEKAGSSLSIWAAAKGKNEEARARLWSRYTSKPQEKFFHVFPSFEDGAKPEEVQKAATHICTDLATTPQQTAKPKSGR